MKKLILIFILSAMPLFSQALFKTLTYQLDGAASDSIKASTGYAPAGLLWPASISDSITIQISKGDGNWFTATDNDGVQITQIALTTKANAVPLTPVDIWAWTGMYYRFIISSSDTSGVLPFTATVIEQPLLEKKK